MGRRLNGGGNRSPVSTPAFIPGYWLESSDSCCIAVRSVASRQQRKEIKIGGLATVLRNKMNGRARC